MSDSLSLSSDDTVDSFTNSLPLRDAEWPPKGLLLGQVTRIDSDDGGYLRVFDGNDLLYDPSGKPLDDVRFSKQEFQLKKFDWVVFQAKEIPRHRQRQQQNNYLIEAHSEFIFRAIEQTDVIEDRDDLLQLVPQGKSLALFTVGTRIFQIEDYDETFESRLQRRYGKQSRELNELSKQIEEREKSLQQQVEELNTERSKLHALQRDVEERRRLVEIAQATIEKDASEQARLLNKARLDADEQERTRIIAKNIVEKLHRGESELADKEEELHRKEREMKESYEKSANELEQRMERWGLRNLPEQEQLAAEPLVFDSETELIDHVHKYLSSKGYSYDYDLLVNFYTCMKLGMSSPIILSGLSGTGKSSLVRYFAEAIGGLYRHIAVRANWTDDIDLRGFYHPERRIYHATPFLHALNEAREHSDRLVFICLDEMNLSRVEYYLAELLSALEQSAPMLDLYSIQEYRRASQERDRLVTSRENATITEQGRERLAELQDSLDLYPARFSIPANVRFCGTVNIDETTQPFSDKVLDRVQIIQLEQVEFSPLLSDTQSIPTAYLSPDQLEMFCNNRSHAAIELEWFIELNDYLKRGGFHFGHRVHRQIENYCQQAADSGLFGLGNINKAKDLQLIQKVLPKLRGLRSQVPDQMFDDLLRFCESDYPQAYQRIQRLKSMESLNYWELFRYVGD